MRPIEEMTPETAAEKSAGLHYFVPEGREVLTSVDWEGVWPEIDGEGRFTGRVVGDEDGYANVADEVMISIEAAKSAGWTVVDGYATPPQPVTVELAEAAETIRICGGLEDFAGLEHPAIGQAEQAYHSAAAEALASDPRARRLVVGPPRGRRILHSQWMGAKWGYQCGAIGVMSESLTEDEKAAISAADDAGLAAARREIEQSDE